MPTTSAGAENKDALHPSSPSSKGPWWCGQMAHKLCPTLPAAPRPRADPCTLTVHVRTRAHTRPHAPFLLAPPPQTQCPCTPAHTRPRHFPPLTLLLHAALQALAEAAGLALSPGLLGDLAGALPKGAPQPGVAFYGSPVREQRAKGRFGEYPSFPGWGAPSYISLWTPLQSVQRHVHFSLEHGCP